MHCAFISRVKAVSAAWLLFAIIAGPGNIFSQRTPPVIGPAKVDTPKIDTSKMLNIKMAVNLDVSDVQSMPFPDVGPSEGQSTIIRPGANKLCSEGALLVSNDWARIGNGRTLVMSRSLTGKTPDVKATFDTPPSPSNYAYGTNDHDLIAMGDGSVLYMTGAFTKKTLSPKPAWFNQAFRNTFGPGARTNLMVWSSTDCGANFKFIAEMDPALMEDGSCAFPQGSLDANGNYDMGGSDGQEVRRDPATDKLYLTFRCVGKNFTVGNNGKITLTTGLNKTLVAMSPDKGLTWKSMGFIDGINQWRFDMLPQSQGVVFSSTSNLVFGTPSAGKMSFSDAQPIIGNNGGFAQKTSAYNPNPSPESNSFSNVWGNAFVARAGEGKGMVYGYPTVVGTGSTSTSGYSVFFHEPGADGDFSELKPILPLSKSATSYVMNVTPIDFGKGPVLLYWMDVNPATHKARIRGRVIADVGKYSLDFNISGDIDMTTVTNNPFPAAPFFFIGDYHTASGYAVPFRPFPNAVPKYRYYPVWMDRGGGARYAVVTVSVEPSKPGVKLIDLDVIEKKDWIKLPPKILRTKLPPGPIIRGEGEEHEGPIDP